MIGRGKRVLFFLPFSLLDFLRSIYGLCFPSLHIRNRLCSVLKYKIRFCHERKTLSFCHFFLIRIYNKKCWLWDNFQKLKLLWKIWFRIRFSHYFMNMLASLFPGQYSFPLNPINCFSPHFFNVIKNKIYCDD